MKRLTGSRRPRTACTADNVDVVEELVMRLENQAQTHVPICVYTLIQSRPFEVNDLLFEFE